MCVEFLYKCLMERQWSTTNRKLECGGRENFECFGFCCVFFVCFVAVVLSPLVLVTAIFSDGWHVMVETFYRGIKNDSTTVNGSGWIILQVSRIDWSATKTNASPWLVIETIAVFILTSFGEHDKSRKETKWKWQNGSLFIQHWNAHWGWRRSNCTALNVGCCTFMKTLFGCILDFLHQATHPPSKKNSNTATPPKNGPSQQQLAENNNNSKHNDKHSCGPQRWHQFHDEWHYARSILVQRHTITIINHWSISITIISIITIITVITVIITVSG